MIAEIFTLHSLTISILKRTMKPGRRSFTVSALAALGSVVACVTAYAEPGAGSAAGAGVDPTVTGAPIGAVLWACAGIIAILVGLVGASSRRSSAAVSREPSADNAAAPASGTADRTLAV